MMNECEKRSRDNLNKLSELLEAFDNVVIDGLFSHEMRPPIPSTYTEWMKWAEDVLSHEPDTTLYPAVNNGDQSK